MERTAANEKAPEPELAEYEAERRKIQNRLYKRASSMFHGQNLARQ